MEETTQNKFSFKRLLPGLLISVGALAILLTRVNVGEIKDEIIKANFRYLPLVILIFLGTVTTRSIAWRTILQEKISVKKAFFIENEGYLLNNVLPFRLGELGRAFLLGQTTSLSFWEVLSTIMVERIFDVAIMASLLLSTLPYVIGADWALQGAIAAGVLVVVGFGLLYLMARDQKWVINLFTRLTKPWPRLTEFGQEKLDSFLSGLAVLRDFNRFGRVLFWMLITWGLNVAWYVILLSAFVPEAKLLWGVFAVSVVSLGVAIPSTPAYIGVYEAVQVGALTLFGIEEPTALAYAIVAHLIYVIITAFFGIIGLVQDGLSIMDIYRGIRQ